MSALPWNTAVLPSAQRHTHLATLDKVQNQVLRFISGAMRVVIAIDRHTRDGRPIYPMLKSIKISLILASDWSSAIKIVMNIDESGFRMPLSFSRQMAPVVSIVRHQVAPLVRAYFCMASRDGVEHTVTEWNTL